MVNKELLEIFEEVDKIDSHGNNQCVNCGSLLTDEYATKCSVCGYDFIEPFDCPYTVKHEIVHNSNPVLLKFCQLTKKQCNVRALDYEVCSVFRSLDSIK